MNLYVIPWPWDFHEDGSIVVVAHDEQEAITKAKNWFGNSSGEQPHYHEIFLVNNGIYTGAGCDC